MSKNDKFYRTLAIIAVVAIVAIAVVVVGPKLLEGGSTALGSAKEPIGEVKESADRAIQETGEVVDTLTSPVSSVPIETGTAGIKAMMVADPQYRGGDIEEVRAEECEFSDDFKKLLENNVGFTTFVFMKYDGTVYVFLENEGKYLLGFLYNQSIPGLYWGDGGPMPVTVHPNNSDNLPPITTKEAYVEAFSK